MFKFFAILSVALFSISGLARTNGGDVVEGNPSGPYATVCGSYAYLCKGTRTYTCRGNEGISAVIQITGRGPTENGLVNYSATTTVDFRGEKITFSPYAESYAQYGKDRKTDWTGRVSYWEATIKYFKYGLGHRSRLVMRNGRANKYEFEKGGVTYTMSCR